MREQIRWTDNHMPPSGDRQLEIMSLANVAKARFFHSSFPQYSVTPLARLDGMARYLGLAGLFVKDESFRFGLNAFKVLGGSFAMARYIAQQMGRDVSEMTYDYLTSDRLKQAFGQATFFTATDGNHGRGVAWAANKLGQKAVVHMPKGSSRARFDNIAREGAAVTIEAVNYDACVRMAAAEPSIAFDAVTCVTPALVPRLDEFKEYLLSLGLRSWRLFAIFPAGRAAEDPALQLSDGQFRALMEFVRRTRREGRIACSYACEGFLGGYEMEARDHFYHCDAGVSVASIRVDGAISGCTSVRADYAQGNIYRDDFWQVWTERFEPFRRREWMRRGACADCAAWRYCEGGPMHLRDADGGMMHCSYRRLCR